MSSRKASVLLGKEVKEIEKKEKAEKKEKSEKKGILGKSRTKSELGKGNAFQGVFGRDLSEIISEQGNPISDTIKPGIPFVVQETISWLEKKALGEEGLFRIPGETPQVERLKSIYNQDCRAYGIVDFDKEGVAPNSVAGLLKQYIRDLPEPLLTFRLYSTFIKVQRNANDQTRKGNLRVLIQKLPKDNQRVFLYLLRHLNNVSKHSEKNKMTPTNLATCWAPNLLRPEKETQETMMSDANVVNFIIETAITEVDFMSVPKEEHAPAISYDGDFASPDSNTNKDALLAEIRMKRTTSDEFSKDENEPTRDRINRTESVTMIHKGTGGMKAAMTLKHSPSLQAHHLSPASPISVIPPPPTPSQIMHKWLNTKQPEEHPSKRINCRGYLLKKGGNVKTFGKRYFVICGIMLNYFRTDDLESPLIGSIHLPSYHAIVDPFKPSAFRLINYHKPYSRVWKFVCKNDEERDKWIKGIEDANNNFLRDLEDLEGEMESGKPQQFHNQSQPFVQQPQQPQPNHQRTPSNTVTNPISREPSINLDVDTSSSTSAPPSPSPASPNIGRRSPSPALSEEEIPAPIQ
eukprot:TRINITY_DN15038_c0_g1_i1.p1 TRINITY_DN15038_c0_g1~~TRINITY_DN15038_c0_g1_i1.p1  ORF type:complete len:576 (+),score=218.04 TRINITY_DN15038_c0_g1_i1:219-1946(+)